MNVPCEMFRRSQSAFDERLVDDHFGGDVRQLASLPGFDLLAHRLKVSLHPVTLSISAQLPGFLPGDLFILCSRYIIGFALPLGSSRSGAAQAPWRDPDRQLRK